MTPKTLEAAVKLKSQLDEVHDYLAFAHMAFAKNSIFTRSQRAGYFEAPLSKTAKERIFKIIDDDLQARQVELLTKLEAL
jgi:hypothetical protein